MDEAEWTSFEMKGAGVFSAHNAFSVRLRRACRMGAS
jgi:hypothetical protein